LYGYEEDQGNKKEQEELIDDNESEDAPVLNLNTQRASPPVLNLNMQRASPQQKKAKESGLVVLVDHLRSRQSPGTRRKVIQNLKRASIVNSQQKWSKTSGSVAFSTKAIGCRLECDKTIPRSSPYSIGFTIRVSAEKWNCLF
jgi:hypothetical protein